MLKKPRPCLASRRKPSVIVVPCQTPPARSTRADDSVSRSARVMADMEPAASPASTAALLDPLKVRVQGCEASRKTSLSSETSTNPSIPNTPLLSHPNPHPISQDVYLSLADADGTTTNEHALFALAGPFPRGHPHRNIRNTGLFPLFAQMFHFLFVRT